MQVDSHYGIHMDHDDDVGLSDDGIITGMICTPNFHIAVVCMLFQQVLPTKIATFNWNMTILRQPHVPSGNSP